MTVENWRLNAQRYSLTGEECSNCNVKIFPPRDLCPDCGVEARRKFQFSGKGEIYFFTTVYEPPAGFEENAPYTIALVRLNEGPMLTAQLTDFGDTKPEIGMPLEMVTRKLRSDGERGVLVYGYKFRPLIQAPTQKDSPVH